MTKGGQPKSKIMSKNHSWFYSYFKYKCIYNLLYKWVVNNLIYYHWIVQNAHKLIAVYTPHLIN